MPFINSHLGAVINGPQTEFVTIRELPEDERQSLSDAADLLSLALHQSPHNTLLDQVDAMGQSIPFEALSAQRSPTSDETRRFLATITDLGVVAGRRSESWNEFRERLAVPAEDLGLDIEAAVASTRALAEFIQTQRTPKEVTFTGNDVRFSPGAQSLNQALAELLRSSESLLAAILLAAADSLDGACRLINRTSSEVLLGTPALLPDIDPNASNSVSIELLPLDDSQRIQVVLHQSRQLEPIREEAVDQIDDGDQEEQAGMESVMAEHAATGSEAVSIDESVDDDPPTRALPVVEFVDLSRHVRDEANSALTAVSALVDFEQTVEVRDRFRDLAGLLAVHRIRANDASQDADLPMSYPPLASELATWDLGDDRINSLGEVAAIQLLLETIDDLPRPRSMSWTPAGIEEIQWDAQLPLQAIALTHLLDRLTGSVPDEPDRWLVHAHRCLRWGMPEAALLYVVGHLRRIENLDDDLRAAVDGADEIVVDQCSNGIADPAGLALTYAVALIGLASDLANRRILGDST